MTRQRNTMAALGLAFAALCLPFAAAAAAAAESSPSAFIHDTARLGSNVTYGDWTRVHAHVLIGDNVSLGAGAIVLPNTIIGDNVVIGPGAVIGDFMVIGSNTTFGKNARIGRGSRVGSYTTIGANGTIGHDVVIGSGVAIEDFVLIEDESQIGDNSTISESSAIGESVQVAAASRVKRYNLVPDGSELMGDVCPSWFPDCWVPAAPCAANYVGNVVIYSDADVAAWSCLQTVDGNLTIADSADLGLEIELPWLSSVTGHVSLDASSQQYTDLVLNALPTPEWAGRKISMPTLATVGGNLSVYGHGASLSELLEMTGLNNVTSVGGNLLVQSPFNMRPEGLAGLASVGGDITVRTVANGDCYLMNMLQGLNPVHGGNVTIDVHSVYGGFPFTDIGGHLRFLNGGGWFAQFPTLAHVGGDFALVEKVGYTGLENLQTVGGNMTLGAVFDLQSLTTVAGELMGVGGDFLTFVTMPLLSSVGSIAADDTTLTDLDGLQDVTVGPGGRIYMVFNDDLPACAVDDFAAVQAAGGWSGELVNVFNNPACP